jgi:hypothetical protein
VDLLHFERVLDGLLRLFFSALRSPLRADMPVSEADKLASYQLVFKLQIRNHRRCSTQTPGIPAATAVRSACPSAARKAPDASQQRAEGKALPESVAL